MHRFENAVNVITQAYKEKQLKPGNSCHCFCGTLTGGKYWYRAVCSFRSPRTHWSNVGPGLAEIKKTGYSLEEIDRIERVFEETVAAILPDYDFDENLVLEEYERIVDKNIMSCIIGTDNQDIDPWESYIAYFIETRNIDLYPAVKATFEELVKIEEEAGNTFSFELTPNELVNGQV